MTQVAAINRAFELEIEKIGRARRLLTIRVARKTYKAIMRRWPVYTGFSKANNRISITGRKISRLEPSRRPSVRGALVAKAAAVQASQLAKLDQLKTEKGFGLKKGRIIIIGNSIDFNSEPYNVIASRARCK